MLGHVSLYSLQAGGPAINLSSLQVIHYTKLMNVKKGDHPALKNQVALVTGATRGIGRAISRQLAQHGTDLILTAKNTLSLEEAARELRDSYHCQVQVISADLQNEEALTSLTQTILKTNKSLDILI